MASAANHDGAHGPTGETSLPEPLTWPPHSQWQLESLFLMLLLFIRHAQPPGHHDGAAAAAAAAV